MKRLLLISSCSLAALLCISWGTFGHEHIDRASVFALPQPLQTFFYNHIDFITLESTIPDLRKYTINDKAENPRHYIDMENYGNLDSLPLTMADAKAKYDDKFLSQNGMLLWYVPELMEKLTKAFKEKRKTEILFIAADLGHYLGDAHMPLHTSANYDGQKTDQKGIHALWESKLPEMFGKDYNYYTGEAQFIPDVQKETRRIVFSSHALIDTLLATDRAQRKLIGDSKVFKTDAQGKQIKNKFGQPVFSDEYATQFHKALNGMVEKQIRASIAATANFWYTAWVNAGKPDVEGYDPSDLTKLNSKQLKKELKLWKTGKLFGIESEKEF